MKVRYLLFTVRVIQATRMIKGSIRILSFLTVLFRLNERGLSETFVQQTVICILNRMDTTRRLAEQTDAYRKGRGEPRIKTVRGLGSTSCYL